MRLRCSEPQSHADANDALVDAVTAAVRRARDRREPAEVANRPVGVQLQVRHVRVRVREMRGVRQVEDFGARLQRQPVAQTELSLDAQIEVGEAGAAHACCSRRCRSVAGDGAERERIEPRLAGADVAENLRRRLSPCRPSGCCPGRFNEVPAAVTLKRRPGVGAEQRFTCHPPAIADSAPASFRNRLPDPNGSSAMNDAWKLCGRSKLSVRFVQLEVVHRLDLRRIVGQVVAADAERLRPRVGDVHLQPCENRRCSDVCRES